MCWEASSPYSLGLGIMEKEMKATILYWGSIGIMGKNMEAAIVC